MELGLLFLINDYEEKDVYYEDAYFDKSENKLYINNSDIVIDNFDYYKLNSDDIKKIREGRLKLPLTKIKYSLKGYILQREFIAKDGNLIYEIFLQSNLAKDILSLLYKKNIDSLTYLQFNCLKKILIIFQLIILYIQHILINIVLKLILIIVLMKMQALKH